jgi:hypothetical protein
MALRIGPINADPSHKSSIPQGGEIGNRVFLHDAAGLKSGLPLVSSRRVPVSGAKSRFDAGPKLFQASVNG